MNSLHVEWGHRMRRMREAQGLSQAAFGALIGIDQSSVSRAECGRGALDDVHRIRAAAVLGVAVAEIWSYPKTDRVAS